MEDLTLADGLGDYISGARMRPRVTSVASSPLSSFLLLLTLFFLSPFRQHLQFLSLAKPAAKVSGTMSTSLLISFCWPMAAVTHTT